MNKEANKKKKVQFVGSHKLARNKNNNKKINPL